MEGRVSNDDNFDWCPLCDAPMQFLTTSRGLDYLRCTNAECCSCALYPDVEDSAWCAWRDEIKAAALHLLEETTSDELL